MHRAVRLMTLIVVSLIATVVPAQYYHGTNGPVSLGLDSTRVLIKFDQEFAPQSQQALLNSIERIVCGIDDKQIFDDFICCSLATANGYEMFLDSLDTLQGIYLVEPYYLLDDQPFPVGEQFIVAFDLSLSAGDIDSINAEKGAVMDRLLYGFESIYVLRNTDSSGARVLDMANSYHDMSGTIFAHPEFGLKFERQTYKLYDYYSDYQGHIKKVIGAFNQKSVWDFAGWDDTVVVAIIDDGVEEHEDLPVTRIISGYDYINNNSNVYVYASDGHGMGYAGIIGASHTTDSGYAQNPMTYTGIFSLNPITKIIPLKTFQGQGIEFQAASGSEFAEAFNWAYNHGADVVSNSWSGWTTCAALYVVDTAILRLYKDGRNGLGTPVIFAAGNAGEWVYGEVTWPACLPYCIAVGATQLNDVRWPYSQYGL